MKITEYTPNWVTSFEPNKVWEINSAEEFYNNFPKNDYGEVILGDGLTLLAITNTRYWLPIATLESQKDWNIIHSWGIKCLSEYLNSEYDDIK